MCRFQELGHGYIGVGVEGTIQPIALILIDKNWSALACVGVPRLPGFASKLEEKET